MNKVLVIEDENKVLNLLKKGLSASGISVDTALNLSLVADMDLTAYDAIVLDRLLEGTDSLSSIPAIRRRSPKTKIIILSALSEVDDRLEGLKSGADDYLGKPFHITELVARLKLACRGEAPKPGDSVLRYRDLKVNLDSQRVEHGSRRVELTAKEYKLLVFLMRNPERALSKSQILSEVWELKRIPESNVVEVAMNHLRAKIDKGVPLPLIHSKRGTGYWFGDLGP